MIMSVIISALGVNGTHCRGSEPKIPKRARKIRSRELFSGIIRHTCQKSRTVAKGEFTVPWEMLRKSHGVDIHGKGLSCKVFCNFS